MKIIESLGRRKPKESSNYSVEYVIAECPLCMRHFTTQMRMIKHNNLKSCGCSKSNPVHLITTKHLRLQNPRLYRIWKNMRSRCNNKNIPNASNYSMRGVSIVDEWNNFGNFLDWSMASGYHDSLSIDRIDVNGDYCPENCRWATFSQQMKNTRLLRKNNTSGYRGVSEKQNKFISRVSDNGNRVYLGSFDTPELAAIAYNSYVSEKRLDFPLNNMEKK